MVKTALILGITGQDGSYLAELLLSKGYEVHGLVRRSATGNRSNIVHIADQITLHKGDMADPTSIYRVISEVKPDEIYNEADQDHVSWSFDSVGYSCDITGAAVGRLLEIVKQLDLSIRVFQPVSSNMFGRCDTSSQVETTPFRPQSPYAAAKVMAFVFCQYYRDVFGMFVSTGIFYNHESPRRSEEYVTRKITKGAASIAKGQQQGLTLGNLDIQIDFGFAGEYMQAAWQIMQLDESDDFIIATGETHSLEEVVDVAFAKAGLDYKSYVKFDSRFARPGKTSVLAGDASKARKIFGFKPRVRFKEIIEAMVEYDLGQ
jgi:GDPmannose 4,6-dehydratase|tara:strand:+ start:724 stop:1677 length:954 start_codon:yes stop_codon:yes gene_type:complete